MKNSLKITSAILVGWLVVAGIVLSQNGWAYGRIVQQSANAPSEISSIQASSLSDIEKSALAYQYREEMVARDLYTHFSTLYEDGVFKNIAESEQNHMDSVKSLLNRYGLPVPVGYTELQSTFDELKASGSTSLQSALEVGLKVEMLDIEDITKTIKMTDNDDLKLVFANIGGASYNHLRGFSKAITSHGYGTSVDISRYLSTDELQSRGSLQYKLSETLQKEGIALPTGAGVGHKQWGTGPSHHGNSGGMRKGMGRE
jgi:hypothetical protein